MADKSRGTPPTGKKKPPQRRSQRTKQKQHTATKHEIKMTIKTRIKNYSTRNGGDGSRTRWDVISDANCQSQRPLLKCKIYRVCFFYNPGRDVCVAILGMPSQLPQMKIVSFSHKKRNSIPIRIRSGTRSGTGIQYWNRCRKSCR